MTERVLEEGRTDRTLDWCRICSLVLAVYLGLYLSLNGLLLLRVWYGGGHPTGELIHLHDVLDSSGRHEHHGASPDGTMPIPYGPALVAARMTPLLLTAQPVLWHTDTLTISTLLRAVRGLWVRPETEPLSWIPELPDPPPRPAASNVD
jgi:hypothetical protein